MLIASFFLSYILQTPSKPSEPQYFTIQTVFTAAGATTAVFTVTSVLHELLPKVSARWFAAFFSLFLTVIGIHVNGQTYGPATILLAFINAAVIYAAAVGVNNITTAPGLGGGASTPGAPTAATRSYRWWH